MKINQLDLFSGIGGFHLGFERAGYKVKSYFSEIDKHAIAVYKNKFKNSEYVGSVIDIKGNELPKIDLITFGSPCQDFSLAGKRSGMSGDRSSLILEAIRLIGECRPGVFVWENVKGTFSSNAGEDFAAILKAFANIGGYRLEWQLLNTSWFLPQNRERIYLVGYSTKPGRDWRGVFPVGEDSGENTKLSGQQKVEVYRKGDGKSLRSDIAPTLTAGANSGGNHSEMACLKVKSATKQGYEVATEGDSINFSNPDSNTRRGRVGKGKAQTLDTAANQAVVQPMVGDYRIDEGLRIRQNGVTPTITQHCSRDSISNGVKVIHPNYTYKKVNETIEQNPNSFKEGEVKALDFYNQSVRNESPCLTDPKHNNIGVFNGYRIRRLTPIECERLQGFPDNHTEYGIYDGEVKKMSNTQRYKQCGNAVTVDVVQAIAEKIKPLFK